MLSIFVCVGSACHLKGSYNIINRLQQIIEERQLGEKVTIKAALCLGKCSEAISVRVDDGDVVSICEENIESFFEQMVFKKLNQRDL